MRPRALPLSDRSHSIPPAGGNIPAPLPLSGPKDPDAYPGLADSVAFPLPPRDAYDDLLTYHLGESAFESSDDLTSDSEDTTPTDETGPPGRSTTYRRTGTSEEGDFTIERTIIRPAPRRSFRADLTRSLTSLAMRSTTTLRAMPSISQLSGTTTPSSPEDTDEDEDGGIVAPPASAVASRRPSLAVAEVTEGLKRLASRLALRTPREQAVDRGHFEESVDHFEETWARTERGEPPVEVFLKRTRVRAEEEDGDASEFYDEPRADFGLGRRGVGIYP